MRVAELGGRQARSGAHRLGIGYVLLVSKGETYYMSLPD